MDMILMKIYLLIGFINLKSWIILKQIFERKSLKILQKKFYQKFWNAVCVKNIHVSGTTNFY